MTPLTQPRKRRSSAARRRMTLLVSSAVLLLAGLVSVGVGVLVQVNPEERVAVPLEVGQPYTAPSRVPFVGDLVVYGTPPRGERPELDEVGCVVTDGGGPLSTDEAAQEDRIVVDGRGLVPLVSFPGREGHSIVCSGEMMTAAAPLFVVPGASGRNLIPLAGYSIAALCLPLAGLGLYSARELRG